MRSVFITITILGDEIEGAMSFSENNGLLGGASSRLPYSVIPAACLAALFFTSTSSSTLYAAPSSVFAVQAKTFASQQLTVIRESAARQYAGVESLMDFVEPVVVAQQSSSWAPLAAIASVPFSVCAAPLAMRPSKTLQKNFTQNHHHADNCYGAPLCSQSS